MTKCCQTNLVPPYFNNKSDWRSIYGITPSNWFSILYRVLWENSMVDRVPTGQINDRWYPRLHPDVHTNEMHSTPSKVIKYIPVSTAFPKLPLRLPCLLMLPQREDLENVWGWNFSLSPLSLKAQESAHPVVFAKLIARPSCWCLPFRHGRYRLWRLSLPPKRTLSGSGPGTRTDCQNITCLLYWTPFIGEDIAEVTLGLHGTPSKASAPNSSLISARSLCNSSFTPTK